MKKLLLLLSMLLCLSGCGQEKVTWDTIPQVEVEGTTYLVSAYLWGKISSPRASLQPGLCPTASLPGQNTTPIPIPPCGSM